MIDLTSNIDGYLSDWGETQTWTPAGPGTGGQFMGVFAGDYAEINMITGSIGSPKPVIECKTSAIAGMVKGDTVTITAMNYGISGVEYVVEEMRRNPDDLWPGMTRLILKRSAAWPN